MERTASGAHVIAAGAYQREDHTLKPRLTPVPVVANDAPVQSAHNVPAALSTFFGRDRELGQLRVLLSTERLVTIAGAGGVGKTRLAHETARAASGSFADGVWLVELASLESPELVATAIAEAVRAPMAAGAGPLERAVQALSTGRHLLVLDNCEHVVSAAADAVRRLLGKCAGLTVLATSRQPIDVEGERVWRLSPLALPDPAGEVARTLEIESVQLFCDRAQLRLDGGHPEAAQVADIAAICLRLDGLPLALELAAAWVRILSLRQVVEQLDKSVGMLGRSGGSRTPRHRTMCAALDWSYRLLTPSERAALVRLSTFAAGFTIEGAAAVFERQPLLGGSTLDLVASLVDRSLVVADTSKDEARYRMLEPVRQYAAEHLAERPSDHEAARAGSLGYLARLAEAAEEPILGGPDVPWLRLLDAELANIRAVLSWGFDIESDTAARLATALIWYCGFRDLFEEGRGWALRSMQTEGRLLAKALHMAGWMSVWLGDVQTADAYLEKARRLMAEGQWLPNLTMVLFTQSSAAYVRGDVEAMRTLNEETLPIARELGDEARIMIALQNVAIDASLLGDYKRALELWQGLLVTARKRRSEWHASRFLVNIVEVAFALNDTAGAVDALRESFNSWDLEGAGADMTGASHLVEGAGCLAVQRGDAVTGLRLLSSAQAIRTRLQYRETPDEADLRRGWIQQATARAGDAAARAASRRGLEMSAEQALAEARAVVTSSQRRPESRERTFMFTDIVRSTELVGAIGDEPWHSLVDWHHRVLRAAFIAHHGDEIDSAGDGFFVAFENAPEAVACAVDIQRTLEEHRRTHGFAPSVRIGVHATQATRSDSGYRGRGVHLAARIAALADGGEIVVSQELAMQLGARYAVSPPRQATLKGIAEAVLVTTVEWR